MWQSQSSFFCFYLFIYLFSYLFIHFFIYLFVCLFIYLFIYLLIYLFIIIFFWGWGGTSKGKKFDVIKYFQIMYRWLVNVMLIIFFRRGDT